MVTTLSAGSTSVYGRYKPGLKFEEAPHVLRIFRGITPVGTNLNLPL